MCLPHPTCNFAKSVIRVLLLMRRVFSRKPHRLKPHRVSLIVVGRIPPLHLAYILAVGARDMIHDSNWANSREQARNRARQEGQQARQARAVLHLQAQQDFARMRAQQHAAAAAGVFALPRARVRASVCAVCALCCAATAGTECRIHQCLPRSERREDARREDARGGSDDDDNECSDDDDDCSTSAVTMTSVNAADMAAIGALV